MNPATAIAQAVRPAGKPLNNDDSAEGVVADCQKITGGLALGMEAEMVGGLQVLESSMAPSKGGDQQMPWPGPAGHCSGQPDGEAAL